MRPFRFSMLQLLLASTLVALVVGLLTSGWRASRYQYIAQVCFSPSGQYLAAYYSGGAVQVWRLDQGRPRLVARVFGRAGLFNYEMGSIHFVGDDKLLKVETQFGSLKPGVQVRQLDIPTRHVTDVAFIESTSPVPLALAATADRLLISDWNTGVLSSYNLKTGRLERNWTFPTPVYGQTGTATGGTTVATFGPKGTEIYVIDLESDRTPIEIDGNAHLAVSRDGRFVTTTFIVTPTPPDDEEKLFLSVHDSSTGKSTATIRSKLQTVNALLITPDNSKLAATDGSTIECFDLSSHELLATLATDDPAPGYINGCALAPTGDRLATHSGSEIVYYDLSGDKKTRDVLSGDPRLVEIILFTLGFAVWSVVWGFVAKRERLRHPPKAQERLPVLQPSMARPVPPVLNWKRQLTWLVAMVVLSIGLVAMLEISGGRSIGGALGDMAAMLAAPIIIVICLVVAYAWLAFFVVGPHHLTLVRLRRLAGNPGRLYREGRLSFWFVGDSRVEAHYKRHLGETLANAEELFGHSVEPHRYRLVACLDRQCELDAFFGRHMPIAAIIPRYYTDLIGLVGEETAIMHLVPPQQAFRSALAVLIVIDQKRGFLAGWAATLLTQQIARDQRRPAELRGAIRRMKVLLARQPDWDIRQVFLRPARERLKLWMAMDEKHGFHEVHAEGDLFLTLGEMLLGADAPVQRREKTLGWLRRITVKDDPVATFTRDVGLTLDELIAEWRKWLQSQSGLPYDPLPTDHRWLLVDVARPMLENRGLPVETRLRMIRQLGCFSVTGAKELIAALADPKIEVRREAIEALEFVSGVLGGDNLPRWQAWWQSLPTDVRGEDQHAAMSRMISGAAVNVPVDGIVFGPLQVRRSNPSQPPTELKACWALMIVGGLIALVIPISLIFMTGPILFPMMYYSLFLGVAAIVHGATRETRSIPFIAKLQLANFLACDLINVTFGLILQFMLRQPHVRQYLLDVNGGRM
jgi:WD40 repeat protein